MVKAEKDIFTTGKARYRILIVPGLTDGRGIRKLGGGGRSKEGKGKEEKSLKKNYTVGYDIKFGAAGTYAASPVNWIL